MICSDITTMLSMTSVLPTALNVARSLGILVIEVHSDGSLTIHEDGQSVGSMSISMP
jgi:hypothetical protein